MVEVSFYLLSVAAAAMLLVLFRGYPLTKVFTAFWGGFTLWILYLAVLWLSGILRNFEFPPRVPILIVIPALGLILVLANRKFMRSALERTPIHIPILLQSFRILVELLIYATYLKGIFPQRATFQGLNFDILVGISALFAGFLAFKGYLKPTGILIWNIVSMGILAVTVFSFISSYYFYDFALSGSGFRFVEFPYLLLASVLLPTAIFLHVFSIRQVLLLNGEPQSQHGT